VETDDVTSDKVTLVRKSFLEACLSLASHDFMSEVRG
jgi:hypothetical protein